MDEFIPISKFKDIVSDCIDRVQYGGERILLERHHKDSAALVSVADYEYLKKSEALRESKIHRLHESEVKRLVELLDAIGTDNVSELLYTCQLPWVLKELKVAIADNKRLNATIEKKNSTSISKKKAKNS